MRLTKGRLAAAVGGVLALALSAIGLILASGSATAASPQSTTRNFLVTLYGWPDNSPPGDGTAFGSGHAGGTGTFSDPVTFATDQNELAPGTVVYYPYLHRYFVMQDECVECDQDWANGKYHIDLWVGGQNANANNVINCEDALTQDSAPVIVDPPSNEPVDTTPLFNSNTEQCYDPSSFNGTTGGSSGGTTGGSTGGSTGGGGGGPSGQITGYVGLCVDVRGASSADGTAVQVYTCNGTNAQDWTVNSNGTLQALGKCLDVQGAGTATGTKVQLYSCNGTGAQTWQASNGALVNPNSGKCLDDTGWSTTPGTQLQIWSCSGNANQKWNLP